MAEINWSLAQTPDYFGGAMQYQQAAQQQRQQEVDRQAQLAAAQYQQQRQEANDLYQRSRDTATDARQERQDSAPKIIETDTMIYGVHPVTGAKLFEQPIPQKAPTAPSGYQWANPNNTALKYIQGGPDDPVVYGERATVQRRAIVQNPTPSRARAGGGSAASNMPPPPSGWR